MYIANGITNNGSVPRKQLLSVKLLGCRTNSGTKQPNKRMPGKVAHDTALGSYGSILGHEFLDPQQYDDYDSGLRIPTRGTESGLLPAVGGGILGKCSSEIPNHAPKTQYVCPPCAYMSSKDLLISVPSICLKCTLRNIDQYCMF